MASVRQTGAVGFMGMAWRGLAACLWCRMAAKALRLLHARFARLGGMCSTCCERPKEGEAD